MVENEIQSRKKKKTILAVKEEKKMKKMTHVKE